MGRLTAAAVVGLGLLLSAGSLMLVFSSNHEDEAAFVAATHLLGAWSFILGGLVAWARRPDNRFGLLLTAVGESTMRNAFSGQPGHSSETSSKNDETSAPTVSTP